MSVTIVQPLTLTPKLRNYARLACVELSDEHKEYAAQHQSDIEAGRIEIILDELTEDNLALAFAERHKRNLRLLPYARFMVCLGRNTVEAGNDLACLPLLA